MRWILLLVALVAAIGGALATLWLWPVPTTVAEAVADLGEAQRVALEIGNRIVSARHLPEQDTLPDNVSPWQPFMPWTSDTMWPAYPIGAPTTIVIYVHGYNTALPNAMAQGNSLLRRLQQLVSEHQALHFFTFAWRGDFYATEFERSERMARLSGEALAAFIERVSATRASSGPVRLILLAHSLGSRTALIAARQLWRHEPRRWLSNLVLVQPAVPLGDLFDGTFVGVMRERTGGGPAMVHAREYEHRGEFADALRVAGQLLITQSSGDSVLAGPYNWRRQSYAGQLGFSMTPNLDDPIGQVGLGKSRVATNYRELRLAAPLPDQSLGHSGLYYEDAVLKLIWSELETFQ